MSERKMNEAAAGGSVDRVRDHLANERTFLAWVRTGIAIVVFGFAIGRFAIAIRQFLKWQGQQARGTGISVWFGTIAIIAGVLLTLAGLVRYRRTREEVETGGFRPAGFMVDLVGILVALFGVAMAVYLVYIEMKL